MKKFSCFIVLLLSISNALYAQVGINTDNSSPDPSALLDVKSTSKGFLAPRVELSAINSAVPVNAPAIGLLVYNTAITGIAPNNVVTGYYLWNGTRWIPVIAPQGTNIGDMQYWNGAQWVSIPVGTNGQVLTLNNGIPTWGGTQVPIISTVDITTITLTTATSGGDVTSDGGASVTARGVCWSTTSNPTIVNNKTTDGTGIGAFSSNLTGLTVNTLYYLRAYATNSIGTSYGNQVSFTTLPFSIGANFGGGIIFYIDGTGQHGLIAATSDQSSGAFWGCWGILIGGTGTAIGTGQANTTSIVNGCPTAGIAARICHNLMLNGYNDWFLPSKDELHQIYLQRNVIGGFSGAYYWSSSEYNSTTVWEQYFEMDGQTNDQKNTSYCVRAIRAF